jgi:acetoacetyl-CoA synthetase
LSGFDQQHWPLTTPEERDVATLDSARLTAFITWLRRERGIELEGYGQLWKWLVDDLTGFWDTVRSYFDVRFATGADKVLGDRAMAGASWFSGARLNYAEDLLRVEGHRPAIIALHEDGSGEDWSRLRLRREVAAFALYLRGQGVRSGDRVVAYLPNIACRGSSRLVGRPYGLACGDCDGTGHAQQYTTINETSQLSRYVVE